ncbi:MAG: carboxymuconolactone decarboxylase family protein [Pseudomonadota bacterium]
MATRELISDDQASDQVIAVFNDIRKTRGTDTINNFWRALAHDPDELQRIWKDLKRVMGPGSLDPLTKELIYIAVSVANSCEYCVHSHTAAASAKGMSDEQHNEFLSVISMAAKTNHLATALQVPLDEALKK